MNGFIKQTAAGLCFGAALIVLAGCTCYRDVVDPCWPARYNFLARQSVRDMHNAQAEKGHILDQTIWNTDFETDKKTGEPTQLSPSGIDRLRYISRRQPHPDFHIFLQFASDVKEEKREAIYAARKAAIRAYLTSNSLVNNGEGYQIDIHDFAQPTYPAAWTEDAMENIRRNTKAGVFQTFPTTGTATTK